MVHEDSYWSWNLPFWVLISFYAFFVSFGLIVSWQPDMGLRVQYLQKPPACVQQAYFSPVEEGGVVVLPRWKDLSDVCGPPQSAVSHQERNAIHTETEGEIFYEMCQ